ncbi:arginase [Candidatus Tokpelaia sp.]|uniref:arginase n=1 Tax=Candidatus Tokpelaia sp. TaxID=2233777 RepID=UPI001239C774|nr:arginase [Candidatus Tokpelaia sp.]KAA6405936.1 arginase [Candidatus Tokpelaia sp.]
MVKSENIRLVGVPVQDGARRLGCEMGPSAYRTAAIVSVLQELGHKVSDIGDIAPAKAPRLRHANSSLYRLEKVYGWIAAIEKTAYEQMGKGFPVFMGGDHIMAAGTVAGIAHYAARVKKPLFVLWLDTHSDFHNLATTISGNLHGTPVAYFSGQPGFEGFYPPLPAAVPPANICMLGLRSVDAAERQALKKTEITLYDMRAIDEYGVVALLRRFLEKVKKAEGFLHVSLDVDFLDPAIAPAVGTAVTGGATYREAHLIMEMLHDSGLTSSLDLAELNPFLDERGRTAKLMTELTASLMGRNIIDYPIKA